MKGTGIEFEGSAVFARDCGELVKRLDAEGKLVDLEAAEIVARETTRRAPVGDFLAGDEHPGELARSVRYGAAQRYGYVSIGNSKTEYTKPIVFGWPAHGIAPNPFPYDALEAKTAEVVALYGSRLDATMARAFEGLAR